jgi:hypothetical protein
MLDKIALVVRLQTKAGKKAQFLAHLKMRFANDERRAKFHKLHRPSQSR